MVRKRNGQVKRANENKKGGGGDTAEKLREREREKTSSKNESVYENEREEGWRNE